MVDEKAIDEKSSKETILEEMAADEAEADDAAAADEAAVDELKEASEMESTEASPEASTEKSKEAKAEASVEAPAIAPAETPIEAPAETPAEAPIEATAETSAEATAETSAEATAETSAEAPAETSAEAPAEAPVEAPAETTTEDSIEASTEASNKIFSDAPTKASEDESVERALADSEIAIRNIEAIKEGINHLEKDIGTIAEASIKTVGEVHEIHKLYHNEFANRLRTMQEELEQYRERDKGRAFDDILSNVAKLYTDNEGLINDIQSLGDKKINKRVEYMFLDIIQILEAHGVKKQKSNVGDKRNTKFCQATDRLDTHNPELHDTIAESISTGFYIENRPLIKELVKVLIYKK